MVIDVQFGDVDVQFGRPSADIIVNYELILTFSTDEDPTGAGFTRGTELLYDKFEMTTSMNVRSENDILHIKILEAKLNLDTKGSNRQQPQRQSIGMTTNDYREFLEDVSFTVKEFKNWLNEIVFKGDDVRFPWTVDELETSVSFENHKLHVMIDVEDKAYMFMEDFYWTDTEWDRSEHSDKRYV